MKADCFLPAVPRPVPLGSVIDLNVFFPVRLDSIPVVRAKGTCRICFGFGETGRPILSRCVDCNGTGAKGKAVAIRSPWGDSGDHFAILPCRNCDGTGGAWEWNCNCLKNFGKALTCALCHGHFVAMKDFRPCGACDGVGAASDAAKVIQPEDLRFWERQTMRAPRLPAAFEAILDMQKFRRGPGLFEAARKMSASYLMDTQAGTRLVRTWA